MSAFSFFSPDHRPRKAPKGTRKKNTPLRVEALEDRSLPSGITISGYVYNDANNNGLMDAGEAPIANNPIVLKNAGGTIIGSTTTDANGYYQFNTDASIGQTPLTLTKTVTFNTTPTDFNLQGALDQFDPSLGTLTEIDITHAGSITSDIKVENTSTSSGSTINGNVSGILTLSAPGVNDPLTLSKYAGTFNAQPYDGQLDFGGTSGGDFGQKTVNGQDSIVLTGSQMNPYIGTGQVQVTENGQATSNATGGGNVVVNVQSTGQSTITVVYKYVPSNSLQPGRYTIVETQEPPGYFPGKNSSDGTVLNNPPGDEVIPVLISTGDAPNNDFGKLKASSLAGTVYYDANDNGAFDPGDQGIAGVTVNLTGTTATGTAVNLSTTTDANGNYSFATLQQGSYTVTEVPPSGYLDGAITAGSVGGTAGVHQISGVSLPPNTDATNYNFGELKGGSLAGFVYLDANDNGVMDTGDSGIGHVTLTLSGTDDHGNAVSAQATSDLTGAYQFDGLRPGNYTITETPPTGYIDASDNAGSLGGTVGHDVISTIQLGMGQAGTQYNFGEKLPPKTDLAIVKTASTPISSYGAQLTYTLQVTNNGPIAAQNVVVTDTLPAGETFVSDSGAGWNLTNTGSTVTATVASLPVGVATPITIVVTVPSHNATLTNVSTVTTDTPDSNPNNDRSTVTTIVQGPPGNPIPQNITPFITTFDVPIISKVQLTGFGVGGGLDYMDPNVVANLAFVAGIDKVLMGASAQTQAGVYTVEGLLGGTLSPQEVISAAWNSPAHWNLEAQHLYQTYLGRNPTSFEQAAVVQALAGGATLQSQAIALLTSPQYQALHPTSDALVNSLYSATIGSTPDGATQQALVQSLGTVTLGAMVTSLMNSQAGLNNTINQIYLDTLQRQASASEMARYGPQLQAGTLTGDQLAQNLFASQEFYQLCYNALQLS
jgi:uncharacterized repeat protein (TIGR01451 family)